MENNSIYFEKFSPISQTSTMANGDGKTQTNKVKVTRSTNYKSAASEITGEESNGNRTMPRSSTRRALEEGRKKREEALRAKAREGVELKREAIETATQQSDMSTPGKKKAAEQIGSDVKRGRPTQQWTDSDGEDLYGPDTQTKVGRQLFADAKPLDERKYEDDGWKSPRKTTPPKTYAEAASPKKTKNYFAALDEEAETPRAGKKKSDTEKTPEQSNTRKKTSKKNIPKPRPATMKQSSIRTAISDCKSYRYAIKWDKENTGKWTETYEYYATFLGDMLSAIHEFDPFAMICPWSESSDSNDIQKSKHIPKTKSKLETYFAQKFKFKQEKWTMYAEVNIASKLDPEELADAMSGWFQDHGGYCIPKLLQEENTKCVGWLLWSSRAMNTDIFQEVFADLLEFPVSFRWRKVTTGDFKPGAVKPNALHIEVNAKNYRSAKKYFASTYARGMSSFPLGIKMRHIMEWSEVKNRKSKENLRMFYQQQIAYCKQVRVEYTWQIVTIDTPMTGTETTLRDLIADIRTDKGNPIIQFIERAWKGEDFVYQPVPSREEEAAMYMDGLLPFLRTKHGKAVDKFFTAEAVEQANNAVWDIQRGGMVTNEDEMLALVNDEDDAFNFDVRASEPEANIPQRREPTANQDALSLSDGSIPTVYSDAKSEKTSRSTKQTGTETTSSLTAESINQRVESLGNQVELLLQRLSHAGAIPPDPEPQATKASGKMTSAGNKK